MKNRFYVLLSQVYCKCYYHSMDYKVVADVFEYFLKTSKPVLHEESRIVNVAFGKHCQSAAVWRESKNIVIVVIHGAYILSKD